MRVSLLQAKEQQVFAELRSAIVLQNIDRVSSFILTKARPADVQPVLLRYAGHAYCCSLLHMPCTGYSADHVCTCSSLP